MASKLCLLGMVLSAVLVLTSGCANFFDAPFKPAPGAFITSYTIPLTTDFEAQSLDALCKTSTETSYLFWPYPTFDLAWDSGYGYSRQRFRQKDVVYADLEVFTVFGLFGSYTVNYYGHRSADNE